MSEYMKIRAERDRKRLEDAGKSLTEYAEADPISATSERQTQLLAGLTSTLRTILDVVTNWY
jgi:hypothetical protein